MALLHDIGFKTSVTIEDVVEMLRVWRRSGTTFKSRYHITFKKILVIFSLDKERRFMKNKKAIQVYSMFAKI